MSCSRYPMDVKAVGFMQCRKQKNYMMFVSWSDQNNILIYRTFEDFKKFHKELKRKFPTESGSLRSLPRFKGITMQQRKGGKLNRCLEILKLLETYSQELLKTDVKISRGEEVNQFFKAQTQDLDPSFPENSVVIMPSVFRREKSPQPLSITLPQASQSYRCIEAFETKDTKNKPFTVAQKEIVEVLIKDMTGWWLVENADKQIAWFPASYLEELDACEDIQNAFSSNEEGSLYFVVQAYEAQKADELSLNQGVVVEVLRTSHDGWWLIRYNGCTGYMPSLCLRPYQNPHHKLQTMLSCGLRACSPSLCSPQPRGPARQQHGRSRSLPRASSTPQLDLDLHLDLDLDLDSSSLSSGSSSSAGDARLAWKADLSRSLPEVEPARSSPGPSRGHGSKSPQLSASDRNDSGFVESSAAELPLAEPELAAGVPRVPARPSAQEILQRCSTVTKRALQRSAPRPGLPVPSRSPAGSSGPGEEGTRGQP
ncbi:NADPH oxidase organizer 1 isoform X2 [Vidua macroura]|nr:NADPH oxidase organizer 1 isoform X2 [Vidua macroura]XP_053848242.1 NADPH oxidase organizer 1 isoform X2 [Vidua macroura]XP_053848243.1 NADPH oxidase organizer 1 isoform X2 [Vidua macroura]